MWKEQNFLHMFTEKYILLLCIHFKKQRLLSDQFDPLPFSAPETQPEQRAPEKPVQDHSRPDAYNAPSMDDQKDHGKMQSLRRQLVKVFRLSVISRSHALAYHSDHSDPYRKSRYGLHSRNIVGHRISGDLYRAKSGYNGHYKNTSELENPVFHSVGDSDIQDLFEPSQIQEGFHRLYKINQSFLIQREQAVLPSTM